MAIQSVHRILFLTLFLHPFLSGCAPVQGNLKPDEKISKATSDIECITSSYALAHSCALGSISEMSQLLAKNGNYDKGSAYLLLAAGTASAVATGFDLDEDVLKIAAVLVGTVVGARTIERPEMRRQILAKGIKELTCAVRVAEAACGNETHCTLEYGGSIDSSSLSDLTSSDER